MSSQRKLRLTVGRFYRTRGGEKVLLVDIFKYSTLIYSYEAQKLIRLTKDGRFSEKKTDFWDLTDEWSNHPLYQEITDDGIAAL